MGMTRAKASPELPHCPVCGVIARFAFCMQCGNPVRAYAIVARELEAEEAEESTEESTEVGY